MRAKVITITGESNYGNSLQNYAVIKTLNKLGVNAETIKTEYEPDIVPHNRSNVKNYIKILLKHGNYMYFKRKIRFKKFSDKYLSKTKELYSEQRFNSVGDCDVLVFGSDQIWNFTFFGRLENNIDFFTGGLFNNIPKIAYSASIGRDYIPNQYIDKVKENLSAFKSISVREDNAKEILTEIIDKDISVTIDPTLMLSKQEWLTIAKKPKYMKKNSKFAVSYFLGELSKVTDEYIRKITHEKGLELINLNSEWIEYSEINNPLHFVTDPAEFIWLIANCEIVFTDSFHGSVFSIIMDKPFRCFERCDKKLESMSSRMDTLFNMFKINSWCRGNINENMDNVFYKDYSAVQSVLEEKQNYAKRYLKGALGIDEA